MSLGSQSVTTEKFRWPEAQPKKVRRPRPAREVVHPAFAECAEHIEDKFWKQKLLQASMDTFPRNVNFYNKALSYKRGAKTHGLVLPANPIEAAYAVIEFYRAHCSIYSPLDQIEAQEQEQRAEAELQRTPVPWKDVSNATKDALLCAFITEKKREMSLTPRQQRSLRRALTVGISCKIIDPDAIHIVDGRIGTVGGLVWNGEKQRFQIDVALRSEAKPEKSKAPASHTGAIYKSWSRFISAYQGSRSECTLDTLESE